MNRNLSSLASLHALALLGCQPEPTSTPTRPTESVAAAVTATASAPPSATATASSSASPGRFDTVDALITAIVEAANANDRAKLKSFCATPDEVSSAGTCKAGKRLADVWFKNTKYHRGLCESAIDDYFQRWKAPVKFLGMDEDSKSPMPQNGCSFATNAKIRYALAKLDKPSSDAEAQYIVVYTETMGWKLMTPKW